MSADDDVAAPETTPPQHPGTPNTPDNDRRASRPPVSQDADPHTPLLVRPHPDAIRLKRWVHAGWVGITLLVLALPTVIVGLAGPRWVVTRILLPFDLLVLAVVVWAAIVWPKLVHKHHGHVLHGTGIEVRKGLAWRRTIYIPYRRIQHVSVQQGPAERVFELASLLIHTAGSRSTQTRVAGLLRDDALTLSRHLTQVVGSGPASPPPAVDADVEADSERDQATAPQRTPPEEPTEDDGARDVDEPASSPVESEDPVEDLDSGSSPTGERERPATPRSPVDEPAASPAANGREPESRDVGRSSASPPRPPSPGEAGREGDAGA